MCCQKPNTPLSLISLPNSRKVRNHGKRNPLPKKIREGQARMNLEEINYASHVNNLGFRDISVQRGRNTALKFSLNMRKRERRKNQNLQPNKRGMKQQNNNNPLLRQEKLQHSHVYLDFTPLYSRVTYKAKRL